MVLTPRRRRQVCAKSADDGDKQARSPGRARRKPLKPLRAGTPGESGEPVVTMLVCFFTFAREAAGAAGARRSPRPLLFRRAGCHAKPGRMRPAGSRSRVCTRRGCLKIESEESGLRYFRDHRLRDIRGRAARSIGSLPPCGGELGGGNRTTTWAV